MDRSPYDAPTIRLADIAAYSRSRDAAAVAPRRIRALINVAGKQIMRGHTLNVGIERLIVSVPQPMDRDQECAVFFGLTIEEQIYSIIGNGRVLTCSGDEKEGYRVELDFVVSDKKSRIALEALFNPSSSNRVQ